MIDRTKILLPLSILPCLFVSAFLMYSWMDRRGLSTKSREIASVSQPILFAPSKEIHHFTYNTLQNKYGIQLKEGKIYYLQLSPSSKNIFPLSISSPEHFLHKYHHLFQLPLPSKFNLNLSKRSNKSLSKEHLAVALAPFKIKRYDIQSSDSDESLGYILVGKQKKKQMLLKVFIQKLK